MAAGWLAKGLLAFMLTFAIAGLAHGQTKSADLPVPQRIVCAPSYVVPADYSRCELSAFASPPFLSTMPYAALKLSGFVSILAESIWPEMGILPWAAKALLEMPSQPASLLASPIERLFGMEN